MTAQLTSASLASASLRVHEFFLARQPILDREQSLAGYELLFRNAAVGQANFTSDLGATASVIAHVAQLGIEKVIDGTVGYLNADAAVLFSDIFQFLPREKVVLEIVESVRVTPEIRERVARLAGAGFRFALDDVVADNENIRQLLPFVDIIKFDLHEIPPPELGKLVGQFRGTGKKLLAEKIEDKTQFDTCLDLGFDYFQGYYFAKPVILSGKKLLPSQLAILQLQSMINADADDAEIESAIKDDASLCFNLLRLVNSAALGNHRRIDSIGQALLMLGRNQLQRWLQIMLYAESSKTGFGKVPLLVLAATRGRLLELMAEQLEPGNRRAAETAFTIGIMSLMDALFGIPMQEILDQVAVSDKVRLALLQGEGLYGDMLKLARHLERIEEAEASLDTLVRRLHLSNEDLPALQLAAFAWSGLIARAT